jgi:hypothetical protein
MTFDIYQLDDEDHEEALSLLEDYQLEVINLFAESPEGQAYLKTNPEGLGGWIGDLIYYGYCYEDITLPQMTEHEVQVVLEELFPRKMTLLSPSDADGAIPELIAFWQFLQREYELDGDNAILNYLHELETEFRDIMNDTSKFGMAKSFFMAGNEAGFDMTTQEGLDALMLHYNASITPKLGSEQLGLLSSLANYDGLEDSDNEAETGFSSPLSLADKAKRKKRQSQAKKSRQRNRKKKK